MNSQPISRSALRDQKYARDNSFPLDCRKLFSNRAVFINCSNRRFRGERPGIFGHCYKFAAVQPHIMCSPFHILPCRVGFVPIPVSCEPLIALQDGSCS
jgi:hypothetical protein